MKVLIIDPWCTDNYEVYTIGLCEGLADKVDLTLCSGYYESRKSARYSIIPVFFKKSDRMKEGGFRKTVRGIEYLLNYIKIFSIIKREEFDVIHIEWALLYKLDYHLFKHVRKRTKKLIYTSHNVIPHVNGEKYIHELMRLHNCFDKVLVHGENIKKEYLQYFPDEKQKLAIQRHGIHFTQKTEYCYNNIDVRLINFLEHKKSKLCVCVGIIFYNKGTDRIIKYWIENKWNSDELLLVAGKYETNYEQLDSLLPKVENADNIMFLPRYLNQDEYSYVLSKADFVTIPYRHASMSGIVYSAAAFSKPIVYTDTGAIGEYVGPNGGIKVKNSDEEFQTAVSEMLQIDKDELHKMGNSLHEWVYHNFDWNVIADKLVEEIYCEGISI